MENAYNSHMINIEILFNPEPVSIKLTRDDITELWLYLLQCKQKGFTGSNNFNGLSTARPREYMYKWHLSEIMKKVYAIARRSESKKTFTLKVSEVEQRTLSVLFTRVDCSAYMLQLQEKFIKNLKPLF